MDIRQKSHVRLVVARRLTDDALADCEVIRELLAENARLTAQLAEARAQAIAEVKAQITEWITAERNDDSVGWEVSYQRILAKLDALAPAPPGAVLVSREDAETIVSHLVVFMPEVEARRLLGLPVGGQS